MPNVFNTVPNRGPPLAKKKAQEKRLKHVFPELLFSIRTPVSKKPGQRYQTDSAGAVRRQNINNASTLYQQVETKGKAAVKKTGSVWRLCGRHDPGRLPLGVLRQVLALEGETLPLRQELRSQSMAIPREATQVASPTTT